MKIIRKKEEMVLRLSGDDVALFCGKLNGEISIGCLARPEAQLTSKISFALGGIQTMLTNSPEFLDTMARLGREMVENKVIQEKAGGE